MYLCIVECLFGASSSYSLCGALERNSVVGNGVRKKLHTLYLLTVHYFVCFLSGFSFTRRMGERNRSQTHRSPANSKALEILLEVYPAYEHTSRALENRTFKFRAWKNARLEHVNRGGLFDTKTTMKY